MWVSNKWKNMRSVGGIFLSAKNATSLSYIVSGVSCSRQCNAKSVLDHLISVIESVHTITPFHLVITSSIKYPNIQLWNIATTHHSSNHESSTSFKNGRMPTMTTLPARNSSIFSTTLGVWLPSLLVMTTDIVWHSQHHSLHPPRESAVSWL